MAALLVYGKLVGGTASQQHLSVLVVLSNEVLVKDNNGLTLFTDGYVAFGLRVLCGCNSLHLQNYFLTCVEAKNSTSLTFCSSA